MSSDLLSESLHYISQYLLYKTVALGGENIFLSCFFMHLCIWYWLQVDAEINSKKETNKNMFQLCSLYIGKNIPVQIAFLLFLIEVGICSIKNSRSYQKE